MVCSYCDLLVLQCIVGVLWFDVGLAAGLVVLVRLGVRLLIEFGGGYTLKFLIAVWLLVCLVVLMLVAFMGCVLVGFIVLFIVVVTVVLGLWWFGLWFVILLLVCACLRAGVCCYTVGLSVETVAGWVFCCMVCLFPVVWYFELVFAFEVCLLIVGVC